VAFTANPDCRVPNDAGGTRTVPVLSDDDLSQLFLAVVEGTEEAVLNSLFAATTTRGFEGHIVEALPIDRVLEILREHRALAAPAPTTKP
jgi:D-aminopeptidase